MPQLNQNTRKLSEFRDLYFGGTFEEIDALENETNQRNRATGWVDLNSIPDPDTLSCRLNGFPDVRDVSISDIAEGAEPHVPPLETKRNLVHVAREDFPPDSGGALPEEEVLWEYTNRHGLVTYVAYRGNLTHHGHRAPAGHATPVISDTRYRGIKIRGRGVRSR